MRGNKNPGNTPLLTLQQKRVFTVNLPPCTWTPAPPLKMNFHNGRDLPDLLILPGSQRGPDDEFDKALLTLDTIKGNSVRVCAQALVCVFF